MKNARQTSVLLTGILAALAMVTVSCGGGEDPSLADDAPALVERIVAAFDDQDMTAIPEIVGDGIWVDTRGRERGGAEAEEYLTPLSQRISSMALTGESVVTADRHAYEVVETVGSQELTLWFIISLTDDGELRIEESFEPT